MVGTIASELPLPQGELTLYMLSMNLYNMLHVHCELSVAWQLVN